MQQTLAQNEEKNQETSILIFHPINYVKIVMAYKCYNMNPQKLEQLVHGFFGRSCLNIDVFDINGNRHTPREWFIAPLHVIEQAIHYIIAGSIINYKYDDINEEIINK